MIREKFVKDFGEEQAQMIEQVANSHANGVNDRNKGKDPFKWALLICIGYQCMEKQSYRNYHQISISWNILKKWIKNYGELSSHNGDCDYLALITGKYHEFIKQ
jgi:hypothetical protein